jgi:2-polyprenyl-6-methoxyphenol hydroxylase-like FAD-dependent oxidoreductase
MPPSMTSQPTLPVLIVGGGPVGMTLALQLQRYQVPYRIIECNSGPSTATKALALHSRTLDIFADLGIAREAVETGHAVKYFRVQSRGKTILRYDFTLLDAAHPLLLSLPQPHTERLLMNRLQALGGRIEWQTELLTLQDHGTHVSATLRKPNGDHEEVRACWVAACDGARSTVRKQLGLTFDGAHYDRHFMLADMDIRWNGSTEEGVFFLGEKEGYVAVAPLDDAGRYRLFVEIPRPLPPEDQRPPPDGRDLPAVVRWPRPDHEAVQPFVRNDGGLPASPHRPATPGAGLPARRRHAHRQPDRRAMDEPRHLRGLQPGLEARPCPRGQPARARARHL